MNPLEILWFGSLAIFLVATGRFEKVFSALKKGKKKEEEKPEDTGPKPDGEGDLPDDGIPTA